MTVTIDSQIKIGLKVVTVLQSGKHVNYLYTVTGTGLNNPGTGIKLVSGGISVEQDWYNENDPAQGHFIIRETDGINTLPLSSLNHALSLVIFDSDGDGTSVPVTVARVATGVIDVVAATASLTAPSIFAEFVAQGVTISDGQQLQFNVADDSGNPISYDSSGIGTLPQAVRSRHKVSLWSAGQLYDTYVSIDDDVMSGAPTVSAAMTSQAATPIYDGRSPSSARPATKRPFDATLWDISELTYEGACRIPYGEYTGGALQNAHNLYFHYDRGRDSIYIAGANTPVQAGTLMVAEFGTLTFVNADFASIPVAVNVQGFYNVFTNSITGNATANLDRITGIYSNGTDPELIVNAIDWYDTDEPQPQTTVVISDKTNIAGSTIRGIYELGGGRSSSGWIGPIPTELGHQADFGATHFNGYSNNDSIDSTLSIGPSAHGLDLAALVAAIADSGPIPQTDTFMNFPFSGNGSTHLMGVPHDVVTNAVINKVTRIRTAFFIPDTNTFACFGTIAGLWRGEQYKVVNDAGELINGDSQNVKRDRYNYYWLFDVRDMKAAKNGTIAVHSIEPYDFGILDLPFQENIDPRFVPNGFSPISGGSFEPIDKKLYLILDRLAGTTGAADRPLLKFGV